jgi:hypothetical protein
VAVGNRWHPSEEADGRGADRPASPDPAALPGSIDPDGVVDALALVVHRLFGIGLEVQSAAGMAAGPVADRLQLIVDELDELIREARCVAFERLLAAEDRGRQ